MSDTSPPPAPDADRSFVRQLPLLDGRPVFGYAIALALAFAAWLIRYEIGDALPPGFPYLTFFPAVIFTAFFFGARPGILVAVVGGILAWYFFIAPANSFELSFNSGLALAFYSFIVTVDIALIHWMMAANRRLEIERKRSVALAERSEMLFRELQHRVGNNLQMIASLLSLQRGRLDDPAARTALDEAAQRLGLIGRIQRSLYDPVGTQQSLAAYIDRIAREVVGASGTKGITYRFDKQVDTLLDPDTAIPAALIVAEAVSNALEHGFGSAGEGTLTMTLAPHERGVEVAIADDGRGLPADFDLSGTESLGLVIAQALAQNVGGEFTLEPRANGRGAVARLSIAADVPPDKEG